MFDHSGFKVRNFAKSRAFYSAALKQLGIDRTNGGDDWISFGKHRRPQLFLEGGGPSSGKLRIAFGATKRAQVRAFYRSAMAAGGKDNGKPGLRPNYHPNYYAAFVLDPDGHNIEAVCHEGVAKAAKTTAKARPKQR